VDPWGLFPWIEIIMPTPLGEGSDLIPNKKRLRYNTKTGKWEEFNNKTGKFETPKYKCGTRTPPLSEQPWVDDLVKQKQKSRLPAKRPGKLGTFFEILCKLFGC